MRHTRLHNLLYRHWWLTFLLLGASFVVFGLLSLNLVHTFSANVEFLTNYGTDAVREGGLVQLAELIATGYAAAAFYLVFKLCEKILVERMCLGAPHKDPP